MTKHEKLTLGICAAVVIIAVALVYSCQSTAQEHGGETLIRLARNGAKSTPKASVSSQPLITNGYIMPAPITVKQWSFATVPHTNVLPPRLSTLQWEIIEYPGWPTIAGGGTQVVFFATWLERATKLPSTNWVKVSVALTPQRTNRATITNVWPQYIRAVHGWRVTP